MNISVSSPLFLAHDSIYTIVRYMLSPIRPSVCLSVRWVTWVATSLETLRDKASNITWRYVPPCWTEIDCKMNDLE